MQQSPFDSVLSPEQAAKPSRKVSPFAASQTSSNPFGAGDSDSLWRNTEAEWMPEDDLKWYQSFSRDQVVSELQSAGALAGQVSRLTACRACRSWASASCW